MLRVFRNMELKEVLILLQKNLRLLIAAAVFGAIALFLFAKVYPVSYKAIVTMYIQRVPEKAENVYSYDGYYAGQAAESYTDTVKGLVGTLDITKRAAEIADLPTDAIFIKNLAKKIKIAKSAPQLVEVTVSLEDREQAKKLALGLAQAASERARLLNQEGDKNLTINIINPDPLVEKSVFNPYLFSLIGALTSFLLVLILICFKDYLKESPV